MHRGSGSKKGLMPPKTMLWLIKKQRNVTDPEDLTSCWRRWASMQLKSWDQGEQTDRCEKELLQAREAASSTEATQWITSERSVPRLQMRTLEVSVAGCSVLTGWHWDGEAHEFSHCCQSATGSVMRGLLLPDAVSLMPIRKWQLKIPE